LISGKEGELRPVGADVLGSVLFNQFCLSFGKAENPILFILLILSNSGQPFPRRGINVFAFLPERQQKLDYRVNPV